MEQTQEPDSAWPPCDRKGPAGELKIWVKTDDRISYQNKFEKAKQMQMMGKAIKNPEVVQIHQAGKKLQMDHDTIGTGGGGGLERSPLRVRRDMARCPV